MQDEQIPQIVDSRGRIQLKRIIPIIINRFFAPKDQSKKQASSSNTVPASLRY